MALPIWLEAAAPAAESLPQFDFTRPEIAQQWVAAHDIAKLTPTAEGLRLDIGGSDPFIHGPARDYPAGIPLLVSLRLKSDSGGSCQVFYFREATSEKDSVRVDVPGGRWFEAKARLPALGPGYRLRIDPPGQRGSCLLGALRTSPRVAPNPPAWPAPREPVLGQNPPTVRSGELLLRHSAETLGSFEATVGGKRMAVGRAQLPIGYLRDGQARWFSLGDQGAQIRQRRNGLSVAAQQTDPDGARWELRQQFRPARVPGALEVETSVSVSENRAVVYLPLVTLLAGLGTYGTNKTQGLFGGVEYLENEPSSSEADLTGTSAQRQVPDTLKITLPLMAIAAEGCYLGLVWSPAAEFAAAFDSPDRLLGSQAHLMGLSFPGSDGANRDENNLLPYEAAMLPANQPLVLKAALVGGVGATVVPAVQQYVALRGLPAVPLAGMSEADYYTLAAHGWLDSRIRAGNLYRHAAWPSFGPQPAADAALYMDWLALKVNDPDLAKRLRESAKEALTQVAPANRNASQVGHVRYPVPALVYGGVRENAEQALNHARALLRRFGPDGSVHYQKPASGLDYGKTHFSTEANGLTAQVVHTLLEAAAFAGDKSLINDALRQLRALDKFRNTVPRGAQTWEIPLHTPDILASAYLARAYTLGFELTGEPGFREQARYWAWTGVPFVYLTPPTDQPVGLYSTIPVLGATGWVAPVWIGLPVQWCGLVYADALYRFARHEPSAPWKQIADGIAVGGIQHTYPSSQIDHQGLLPDSYNLRLQGRNGPAINPATVLAPALRYYRQPLIYDFHAFRKHGLLVHAPGEIARPREAWDRVAFTFRGWSVQPSCVLINGLARPPQVRLDGKPVSLSQPHEFHAERGWLILQLPGTNSVEIIP